MEQLSFTQNFVRPSASVAVEVAGSGMVRNSGATRTAITEKPGAMTGRAQPKGPLEGPLQGNVTEIILPPGQVENFQLLLPMLTQLNQERRWLAWIDPPQALVNKWQTLHGIVAGEILVLRSSADYSAFELAERALGAGTCHAVVMWTSKLSARAFDALHRASAQGRSHGVILRQR